METTETNCVRRAATSEVSQVDRVDDIEYVPTRVWTHSGDRSHIGARMGYTLVYVLTTFLGCLISCNMITINALFIGALRRLLVLARVDLTHQPILREFMESASGWCIDFGAYFVCRLMHSLGIWRLTLLGRRIRWRMSRAEWDEWRVGRGEESEDGVIMVPLPKARRPCVCKSPHCAGKGGACGQNESCTCACGVEDLWIVGGSMIVSNHMSNIDGFVTKATLIPCTSKALIKSGAIKAPFVGQLLWASGQCFVWRNKKSPEGNALNLNKTYARCNEVIENNVPIVCYPEGTRRMFGRMNCFKLGMIGAAVQYEWPVHVSVIHGSHRAWPPRELLVNKHPIYVKYDDRVIVPRRGIDTAEKLATAIRNRMLKLMEDVPGYEPQIEKPLLHSSDLRKILELAKRKNEIRNSFLS